MKYSLLIFLFAFLSFSFYQNKHPENFTGLIESTDSCLLKNVMTTSVNDTGMIDTSFVIISYDKMRRVKKVDNYFANGGNIYVVYDYDKEGRIRKLTDHYVLKIDYNGYSKGDVANRIQKRFKYRKGTKIPKQVKYLSGTAWERGVGDQQLNYKGKTTFKVDEEKQSIKLITKESGHPKSTTEYTYDYLKKTIWRKKILHTKSGDIVAHTTEQRYDELLDTDFLSSFRKHYSLPGINNYRFGNNVIYSKMVYGKDYKPEKYGGKVAHEYKLKIEYNENGFISKSTKRVINNFDQKEIGKIYNSEYEYICQ